MKVNSMVVNQKNGVSVITCTNKKQFISNIFENYSRQLWRKKELIIVLNSDSLDLAEWQAIAKTYNDVTVFQLPEETTLGACLNFGVKKSSYPFIAKFDDDDFYSRFYLQSSMKAFARSGAHIVGRRSYFTYFEDEKSLTVRFPKRENSFQKYVAGGTIMFKKEVFKRVQFPYISVGEDFTFLDQCRAKGYRIYATNRYNYVYIRRNDNSHTWNPTKSYLKKTGRFVTYTDDFRRYTVRAY